MRPAAPSLEFGLLACRSTQLRSRPDPLISLPTRTFSCVAGGRRKTVHALTENGARLEASHKLGVMPSAVTVVEIERELESLELA